MTQRVEFGHRSIRRSPGELLLPTVILCLLAGWLGALRSGPPMSGFLLEWGAWLVLWFDVLLAAGWLWRRLRARSRMGSATR